MASGNNHDAAIVFTTPFVGYLGYQLLGDLQLSIFSGASYLIGGLFLSPDLDLPHSNPSRRWGFLKWVWGIYFSCIPHRHFLSHAPMVGTIGRVVYLNLWLLPIWMFALDNPAFSAFVKSQIFIRWALVFIISVEVSAWNHLFLDGLIIPLPSGVKKKLQGDGNRDSRRSGKVRKIYLRNNRK